ncbi:nitrate reductase molybdenum cofactor assembly chaperone [Georgenia sp. EYE_87]|uniref:nitrate reductase molybdenum cofactor assembly chaperone n=1 Tax=Georgenia sp. EYE_87 TaxID=2853448 RepID=UPI0020040A09|nr:nitrate reductase molybdenum cofactor assembly chaperone [Georgenia sp. EYE_87]MCK6211857.1 nitrate reductase molybdenum cofactor assembly chaperone [Georgenia sp. EYE_87]
MSGFLRVPGLEPLAPVRVTDRERALACMAASVLLDYPDPGPDRDERLAAVRSGVAGLPEPVRSRLAGFVDHALTQDPQALARAYVDTFDLKRKCSMYLSYFVTGDTRRRGTALVRFVEAYRAAGWEVGRNELPDFLPIVLEFTAVGDAELGTALLAAHREGVEVLRSALTSLRSPWAAVVEAVCLVLPRPSADVEDRLLQLITAGPPTEMVGLNALGPLEPFAPGGARNEEVRA